jgi:hypothetical protein
MVGLIISMGIIMENVLKMCSIMGGGNVNIWHDCIYIYIVPNCNIVVALMAHLQEF